MITLDQARTLSGKTMTGAGGEKLGTIDTLYADREDGAPTFATVQTGAFGSRTHFVPLAQATLSGDTVTVPYDRDLVSSAPSVDPDAELEPAEEERLYSHYGVGPGSGQGHDSTTTTGAGTGTTGRSGHLHRGDDRGAAGRDTSGPTTGDATTRSEERLDTGTLPAQESGSERDR